MRSSWSDGQEGDHLVDELVIENAFVVNEEVDVLFIEVVDHLDQSFRENLNVPLQVILTDRMVKHRVLLVAVVEEFRA